MEDRDGGTWANVFKGVPDRRPAGRFTEAEPPEFVYSAYVCLFSALKSEFVDRCFFIVPEPRGLPYFGQLCPSYLAIADGAAEIPSSSAPHSRSQSTEGAGRLHVDTPTHPSS